MKILLSFGLIIVIGLGGWYFLDAREETPNTGDTATSTTTDTTGEDKGILPLVSGVSGTVTRGPICPVVREGIDCPDKPHQTVVEAYIAGAQKPFGTTQANVEGKYSLVLPPGTYTLRTEQKSTGNQFPICPSTEVVIGPYEMVTANIVCDTGIR